MALFEKNILLSRSEDNDIEDKSGGQALTLYKGARVHSDFRKV